jgi:hypothetical protein
MRTNCLPSVRIAGAMALAATMTLPYLAAGSCWAVGPTLENESVKLSFEAQAGGRCVGLELKQARPTLVLRDGVELMREIFDAEKAGQAAPIAFTVKPFKGDDGNEGLLFSATLGENNGNRDVAGLQLERRVWLPKGKRHVEVANKLINRTADVTGAKIGTLNRFCLDKRLGTDAFFLPTDRTVLKVIGDSIDHFYTWTSAWEYGPVESWVAAANPESPWSLVFVLDAPAVDAFYASNRENRLGWLVDGQILEPEKDFASSYAMIPVSGFTSIVHASRRLVADLQVVEKAGGPQIVHTVAGATAPLGSVTLQTTVIGARTKQSKTLADVQLKDISLEPSSKSLTLSEAPSEPLIVRVVARGQGWEEKYEGYYEGKFRTSIYPGYPYKPEYMRKRSK